MLTTTLRHGCCKLCVSQTYEEDHDSTDCKCNSCTKHTTGFNPVTGRNYPAPADHGAKCNYKYVPCTKYFVKFRCFLFHRSDLLFSVFFCDQVFQIFCCSLNSQKITVNKNIPVMSITTVTSCQCQMSFMITLVFLIQQKLCILF